MPARSGRRFLLRASSRVALEGLESRRLMAVTVLSNGSGPGATYVGVDAYGAFGYKLTGEPTKFTDFSQGTFGEIDRQYLFFSPTKQFLTEGPKFITSPTGAINNTGTPIYDPTNPITSPVVPTPSLAPVNFQSASALEAVSTFELKGVDVTTGQPFDFNIVLTQSLSTPAESAAGRLGVTNDFSSTLTQTYAITNLLGTTSSFSLVRYLQTTNTSPFAGGLITVADQGKTFVIDNGLLTTENSLEFRASGGNLVNLGVQTVDGVDLENVPVQGAYDAYVATSPVNPTTGFLTLSKFGIDGSLLGGNTTVNSGEGLAQQYDFSIDGRQTLTYSQTTVLGQGPSIAANGTAGDVAFAAPTYNYNYANGFSTLNVVVERLHGSVGALTVNVSPIDGTISKDKVILSDGVTTTAPGGTLGVTFADGDVAPKIITVSIPSLPPLDSRNGAGGLPSVPVLEARNFDLALSIPGANVINTVVYPPVAQVNVLPTSTVFSFAAQGENATPSYEPPLLTANAVQNHASGLTVTVYRTGNLAGPATVFLQTSSGQHDPLTGVAGDPNLYTPAVAGRDYGDSSLYDTTAIPVNFANGESSKTITIPLGPGSQDNGLAFFSLHLVSAGAGVIPVPYANVQFTNSDAGSPSVTDFHTVPGKKGINAVNVTFSEKLRLTGDASNYSIFLRSNEGLGGTAKLKAMPIGSISYDPNTLTVTLTPTKPLPFNKNYQLTVAPSTSLTDLSGNTLNQDVVNGRPNYTAFFAYGTSISYVDSTGDTVTLTGKKASFELTRFVTGEASRVTLFDQTPANQTDSFLNAKLKARKKGTVASSAIALLLAPNPGVVTLSANLKTTNNSSYTIS